jgi:hypothetical protein
MAQPEDSAQRALHRFQRWSLLVGLVGLALCAVGAFFNLDQFLRAYLMAYFFWLGIALGCLAIMMVHSLTGGAWGIVIHRFLEAGARTLPLLALLFVPLVFGLQHLYIWARPEAVDADALLQHKSAYLNVPFFLIRAAVYFVIWVGVSYLLQRWSLAQERAEDVLVSRRSRVFSGPGLVLYGLAITFASIDWVMSLEPHWYSTIYGFMVMVGQGLAALAFVIVATALLADYRPLADVVRPGHFHDLGNLLLMFVLLWAYLAYSQYVIIWSGNLLEEIPWYLRRTRGGWVWMAWLVILFYFVVPFLLLLSRDLKRNARALAVLAAALTIMSFVDLFWRIEPAFQPVGLYIYWIGAVAAIGLGGIWLAAFVWFLRRRSLLPLHEPYVQEALAHGRE